MEFHMVLLISQHKNSVPSCGKVWIELKQAFTKAAASGTSQLGLRKETILKKKFKNHDLHCVSEQNFFSVLKLVLSPFWLGGTEY